MFTYLKKNYDIVFKIVYLIHLFISFNTFLNVTVLPKISTIVLIVTTGIFALLQLLKLKDCKNKISLVLSFLFLASYAFTSLMMMNYNFTGNIKCLIWMVVQLIFLYFYVPFVKGTMKRDIQILFTTSVVYITIVNIIGFILMYNRVAVFQETLEGSVQFYGFWFGRLYGLYNDPNHAAIIAAIGIFLAIGLLNFAKKKSYKVLLIISMFIQLTFISFTDSRSGLLSLIAGMIAFVFMRYFFTSISVKSFTKSLTNAVLVSLLLFSYTSFSQSSLNYVNQFLSDHVNENSGEVLDDDSKHDIGTDLLIGREEDISEDLSNRRFDIWKSGLEIFSTSQIYGIGYNSIVPYTLDHVPDTYLVANDYKVFDSFHNSFVDVLVSQGTVGIVIFVILMIVNLRHIFAHINLIQYNQDMIAVLTGVVCCVLVSSLFLSNILYINSIESFYFWCSLGYLNYLFDHKEMKEALV